MPGLAVLLGFRYHAGINGMSFLLFSLSHGSSRWNCL